MEDTILRGEVYSKINILLKRYNLLLNQEFPSAGSWSLTVLIIKILKQIKKRFVGYSTNHLKLLCNNFFPNIEEICGYLTESEISKVPWSIIPAIDKLFQDLMPGFFFAVGPIWESNYMIFNKDILELFKEKVVSIPFLLFDATKEFNNCVKSFLEEFPDGIYMTFFPKIERKSALHFALLGHEIGHKFALSWLQKNFSKFIKDEGLENRFRKIATEEIEQLDPKIAESPIFGSPFVEQRTNYYSTVTAKILGELLSDIFGTMLFGETMLIATYLYSIKKNLDDVASWQHGYLSWRYRIKLQDYALRRVLKKADKPVESDASKWQPILEHCLKQDFKDGKESTDNYLHEILTSIEKTKEKMCDDMEKAVGGQLFLGFLDVGQIKEARKRIADRIIPNSYIEGEKEIPIEFRNILYGTWLELSENIHFDPQKYMKISNVINLLSIKGIELSIEQQLFNINQRKNDSNKD